MPTTNDLRDILQQNEIADTFRISFMANSLVLPVYDRIKRDFDLSRGEYLLLFCLAYADRLTAQDIADVTGRPRNSISRAVHRVLELGYISRSPDPVDGRQALLELTASGANLHKQILPLFIEREKELLGILSKEERQTLDTLLGKLAVHTEISGM